MKIHIDRHIEHTFQYGMQLINRGHFPGVEDSADNKASRIKSETKTV